MRILNWQPKDSGTQPAVFDIELASGLVLKNCRMTVKGDRRFVSLPEYTIRSHGRVYWIKAVEIPDIMRLREFSRQVFHQLRRQELIAEENLEDGGILRWEE